MSSHKHLSVDHDVEEDEDGEREGASHDQVVPVRAEPDVRRVLHQGSGPEEGSEEQGSVRGSGSILRVAQIS